jgi:signal peptidase I
MPFAPLRVRRDGLAGPWRVAVVEGSMRPAIEPGDWLLVDPTVARWPRRGSIVVFREPGSDDLAIKRVAARPGDWVPFADSWLQLADDEAWLIGDATDEALQGAGFAPAVDSRRYGPVPLEALVARAWFRYWPSGRIGRIGRSPADLLARGREGRVPSATAAAEDADRP